MIAENSKEDVQRKIRVGLTFLFLSVIYAAVVYFLIAVSTENNPRGMLFASFFFAAVGAGYPLVCMKNISCLCEIPKPAEKTWFESGIGRCLLGILVGLIVGLLYPAIIESAVRELFRVFGGRGFSIVEQADALLKFGQKTITTLLGIMTHPFSQNLGVGWIIPPIVGVILGLFVATFQGKWWHRLAALFAGFLFFAFFAVNATMFYDFANAVETWAQLGNIKLLPGGLIEEMFIYSLIFVFHTAVFCSPIIGGVKSIFRWPLIKAVALFMIGSEVAIYCLLHGPFEWLVFVILLGATVLLSVRYGTKRLHQRYCEMRAQERGQVEPSSA